LEEARSFDVVVGDVGGVANVGEAGIGDETNGVYCAHGAIGGGDVGSWRLANELSVKRII
jgi:hypothetical protein